MNTDQKRDPQLVLGYVGFMLEPWPGSLHNAGGRSTALQNRTTRGLSVAQATNKSRFCRPPGGHSTGWVGRMCKLVLRFSRAFPPRILLLHICVASLGSASQIHKGPCESKGSGICLSDVLLMKCSVCYSPRWCSLIWVWLWEDNILFF